MTKCRGCGIKLQDKNPNELGYTNDLTNEICTRCFKIANYGEYKKVTLNNNDYQKIIKSIPDDSLVLYTTDILSLNIDNINNLKNVILVITKRDIIPTSAKEYKLINKIKKLTNKVLDVIVVSSKTNYNIDELYNKIIKLSNKKPVYIIGYTNTGKSTLINTLIKNYSDNKTKITESIYPSTTLDTVEIKINNLTIIDTPGLIDEGNIINYLSKEKLKQVLPKKAINPKTCQINNKGSIIIDKLLRIDYETEEKNSIVIYCSQQLNIKFISKDNNILKDLQLNKYNIDNNKDLVIPGLCFIKITKKIKMNIYSLSGTKPYIRNNLI